MKEEGGKGQPSPALSTDGHLPTRPAFSGHAPGSCNESLCTSQPPTSANNTVCAEVSKLRLAGAMRTTLLSLSVWKTIIQGSRKNASVLNQTHILLKIVEYLEHFSRRNFIVETRDLIVRVKQTQKVHHFPRWEDVWVDEDKPGVVSLPCCLDCL